MAPRDEGAVTPRPRAARGRTLQGHKDTHLLAALAQVGLGALRAAGGLHPLAHHSQTPVGQMPRPCCPREVSQRCEQRVPRGTVTAALPTATGHTAPAQPRPSPLLNASAGNRFINN